MNFSWVLENELAGSMGPSSFDDLSFLYHTGIRAVIRMEEQTISSDTGNGFDLLDMFEPVPDFTAPHLKQIHRMVEFIDQQTARKRPVAVSCYAGIGRTGTVLACYLVHRGQQPAEAINLVRKLRPKSVETADQEAAIYDYARWANR